MPLFEVRDLESKTLRNRTNAYIAVAEDAASAKRIAQAELAVSSSLNNAVVTEIGASPDMFATAGSMDGWRFQIDVTGAGAGGVPASVSVVGGASDALDDVGTALATALNGLANIANALYTAATQTLRVAEGATDALGDESVFVTIYPPLVLDDGGQVNDDIDQEASFVSSITHEGASSADLTIVFKADTTVLPVVQWGLSRP
jgi:hypothetical protein